MATDARLAGWNIDVMSRTTVDDDGTIVKVWTLVLMEKGTGNRILYEHSDDVRTFLVGRYTGVAVASETLPDG